jgi:hypothetical protein
MKKIVGILLCGVLIFALPFDGSSQSATNQYVVTSGRYLPENALAGAQNEFGALAQLADWNDISSLYSDNISGFMDAAGIRI